MSKNNKLRNTTPERRNYKLYKAKKQWITACATFLLTFGATAVMNVSAQADVENNVEPIESAEIETNGSAANENNMAAKSAVISAETAKAASSSSAVASQAEATMSAAKTSATSAGSSAETANNQSQSASVASTSTSQATPKAEMVTDEATAPISADAATKTAPADENAKTGTASQTAETSTAGQATSSQTAELSVPVAQPSVETGDKVTVKGATTPQTANPSSNVIDETTLDTKSAAKVTQKQAVQSLAESEDSTENIAPEPYNADDDSSYIVAGSTINPNDAYLFLKNGQALLDAGAKIEFVGTPDTGTKNSAGDQGSATIKITYEDGTTTEVTSSFYLDYQMGLSQLDQSYQGYDYYYVKHVGDKVDSFDTPDENGNVLFSLDDPAHSLLNMDNSAGNSQQDDSTIASDLKFKLIGTIDTSTAGIHFAKFQVTSRLHNGAFDGCDYNLPILGTYTVEVPYIVQGLKIRDDIPKDENGDPVINAQLSYHDVNNLSLKSGFDPTKDVGTLGQYFYQDYALAYALGVKSHVTDWTAPTDLVNTKTNHFTLNLNGLDQPGQNIDVKYATNPQTDQIYLFNQGSDPTLNYATSSPNNEQFVKNYFNNANHSDAGSVEIWGTDGKLHTIRSTSVTTPSIYQSPLQGAVTTLSNGQGDLSLNINFDGFNSAGQPLIFGNGSFAPVTGTIGRGTAAFKNDLNNEVNKLFQNGQTPSVNDTTPVTFYRIATKANVLYPARKVDDKVFDVSDGTPEEQDALAQLVRCVTEAERPGAVVLPKDADGNTIWPANTTFSWQGTDGADNLILNKAGMTKKGDVTITLGSTGTTCLVKDITVRTKAEVNANNETFDYGTKKSAADLVTNKDMFPEGTTYQFVNNSEPDWTKPGSYNNVQITATYPLTDENGNTIIDSTTNQPKTVTTPVKEIAIAINDSRIINVFKGSTAPSIDDILALPTDWEAHTATWTHDINTDAINQGEITIHYPSSGLDQVIKVYVNVIPKLTTNDNLNFKTDGESYDGSTGKLINDDGDLDSSVLISDPSDANYESYQSSGTPGTPSTISTTSQTQSYTVSGLQKNADGTLVSGPQTITYHISVPKGTIGAQTDADGNSYYEITSHITVAQPVTFEFVDDDSSSSEVVGTPQTQEFIKGTTTDLDSDVKTNLTVPENYQLATGQTVPDSYTLADYSTTNPVVQIHLVHKKTVTVENQTKSATVHYINGATGQAMGSAAPDASWTAYYTRNKTVDLVTNQTTYSDWQLDTSKGTNGISETGSWTVDAATGKVTIDVPTVNGYTAYDANNKKVTSVTLTPTDKGATATVTYEQSQSVSLKFVDDDNHEAQVGSTVTEQGFVGHTDTLTLDLPTNYQLVDNQTGISLNSDGKVAVSYKFTSADNQAVTIHLKHKTEDVSATDPQAQETRTITVKYINAATGQSMGTLAPDAVMDVYYKRSATKDLVTGTVTYGNWQWDSNRDHGYKVISGTWDVPTAGVNLWSTTPTVAGYTAIEKGNWEKNSNGSIFTDAPATRFCSPDWNGNIAYLSSNPYYDCTPTHIVYFAPDKAIANRTLTVNYKYWENGQDAGNAFDPAHVTLNYTQYAIAYNSETGTITYSDDYYVSYSDVSTPAGSNWSNIDTDNQTGEKQIGIPQPTIDGYTAIVSGSNNTSAGFFGAPNGYKNDSTVYTNPSDSNWSYRPSLTVFYVKNSDLQKSVTRTINVTKPGETSPTTTTQEGTIKRTATLNDADNGVQLGNWTSTQNWAAQTVSSIPGYTTVIKQVVTNPDGTTTETTIDSIPAVTIDDTTKPTTINVTYTANDQSVDIKFVDDDDGQKVVKSETKTGKTAQTINFSSDVPKNYELVPGQSTSYTFKAKDNTPITIHLKHQTKNITDPDVIQQTRTIRVNFIDAATDQPMGTLAPDAVMDVYYKRTATEDLVTGKTTYGTWQWDTSRDHGYKVVSGSWNTPASGQFVVATIPSVDGYTSVNQGIWQKNSDGGHFSGDANRFCAPDWNGDKAYLSTNFWYDTTPTHTVYYVPNNESRDITVLKDSAIPAIDNILNLPAGTPAHTTSWVLDKEINTSTANQGEINIYYTDSGINQTVKVNVKVVPKLTAKNGIEFTTDGNLYDGTTGSIKNGDNEGQLLIKTPSESLGYTPSYSVSGLHYDSNGKLVSGNQTATIRISVPKGTFGAQTDSAGNSYYEVASNIVVAQPVTFEFVDDDSDNAVVGTPQTQEFIKGAPTDLDSDVKTYLTVPENYQLATGQSIPTSYTLADYSATNPVVQIHLKHQTQDVSDTDKDAKETRTLTVNYVNASTGQAMEGLTPAQLQVFYKRSATKDLVTNKVTYGNWQWDTSQGNNGYNVLSGDWTLPSTFDNVIAKVPTVSGYTAFTKGDWEKNKNGDISSTAANEFVFPTYDGHAITTTGNNSVAYTDDSPVYEGTATHTVYFAPAQVQDREITEHYKKYNEDGTYSDADVVEMPDGSKQSYAQIKVWYQKNATGFATNGSTDHSKWTITYGGDWSWDQAAGDTATPGYTVISGGYTGFDGQKHGQGLWSITNDSGSSWKIGTPTLNGYTVVTASDDNEGYHSISFAGPAYGSVYNGSAFTDNKNSNWLYRNDLTTFYVPNDLLKKNVTRTINIHVPASNNVVTVTQTVTFERTARINKGTDQDGDYGDTKIVFGGITGSDVASFVAGAWNHTASEAEAHETFAEFTNGEPADSNIVKTGYTAYINGQPVTSVAALTITPDAKDSVVDVTYSATATAKLTGDGSATYTGKPITTDDLNNSTTGLKITVTGPTADAGSLALNAGDVEFSTDGRTWTTTLPTNADTYQVRLTTQGENAIKNKYGNANIVWTEDGHSTITSDAKFTINPLSANSVLNNLSEGNYTEVYDGSATTSVDPSKLGVTVQLNGQAVNLDMTGLTGADFQWVDADGHAVANPQNVGTYHIKLTNSGLTVLQDHNKNFALTNSGLGTYTITQAQASATLSGAGTRVYNGTAVTVDDLNRSDANNNITLTLHYPKNGDANYSETVQLTADDFVWNTPDGNAPVNANSSAYTISLKPSVIKTLLENAAGKGQGDKANVTVADDAITGSASYKITPLEATATLGNIGSYGKTYDATSTNEIDPSKLQFTTTVNGQTVTLNASGLTGNDFAWVGLTTGDYPKNVGTYSIELTDEGLTKLQADNPNFVLTKAGNGTYTISQAQGTATLSGGNEKTYNGQAITTAEMNSNGQIVVNLTFPGSDTSAKYTLADGDYTITPNDSADSNLANAGTYTIALTAAGKAHVKAALEELAGKGQDNQANATVADSAITGDATFTVNASKNLVNVNGNQTETYTGSAINVVYNEAGTNSVTVSISNATGNTGSIAGMTNVHLVSGDFQIVDASDQPTTAINAGGTYHIVLTADGVTKVQNAVGKNYQITQGISSGTLVINKAYGSVTFSGDPSYTYTGSANPDYLKGFSIQLNEPNNPTYKLVAGDIEFKGGNTWTTAAPIDHGTYQVRLSQAGWDHIKAINSDNITWSATASAGTGTYTIKAANATTKLSGSNQMVYNGNAVTTDDLYTDGSTIKVTISGENIANLPTTFRLEDGDYTWNTSDYSAPKNQGDYTITLTKSGLDKIQAAINAACGGTGNVVLDTTHTGQATFHITQSVVSNLQLHGDEQSTYNGQAVQIDPTTNEFKENYGFNNANGLTIPDMDADDFEWVDADGNAIATPKDAGTYYLQLSKEGRDAIANANKNYTFVDNKGNSLIKGKITYKINPATLVIGISGTASKVYDGQNAAVTQAQINHGDIKVVWSNGNTSLTGEPTDLGEFALTPDDLEVVDASGNPVFHANAADNETTGNPIYYVRLKDSVLNTIKGLTGAKNYDISLSTSAGNYLIYQHKAEVTLSGNQTTYYGTDLPLDPGKYSVSLTNWPDSDPDKPNLAEILRKIGGMQAGDVYIKGYVTADKMPNGQMPKNVGTYQVMISSQLLNRLKNAYNDYDWDAIGEANGLARDAEPGSGIVEAEHDPATYVIKQAEATVTINGAQHIKYGETANIQYGGTNGYTISITAPANGVIKTIYTDATFDASDLEFVTTPGNVGSYTVKLSDAGLRKLAALTGSSNYDWKQATDAENTPTAEFYVNQMPVTITVNNDTKEVTYGTADWLTAIKRNPQGYTLTVKTDAGSTLNYTVQDGDLIFSQTPGSVGTYEVKLSDQGLTNIKNALGTNYAYPQAASDVTTHGTFKVNQGTTTVTLSGNDSKTYNGQATTPADLHPTKYSYSATVYAPDGTAQTITLTKNDLQFVDADGNAITPTKAGTYTVELSPAGKDKLKNLTGNNGDNYQWTFKTTATYKITEATDASAALSGSNEKVFDGSGVTTAQINHGGSIEVKFTYPGSTDSSIYKLQDGDYDWYSADGNTKLTEVPSQKGTYTIKLTSNGLTHLQNAIDNAIGSGNVTLSADKLSGSATFEIIPKPISGVTISGNDQSKTYDGQAAGLDLSGLNISGTDTVSGTSLSRSGLTADDFDWYDASGNKLDEVPKNVGTYEAHLTDRALAALQNANPNYSFNEVTGTIKYTINPKAATDKLGNSGTKTYNGQGTSVSDIINSVTWTPGSLVTNEHLDLSSLADDDYEWMTKNADGTYTTMTGLPTNVGTYYLKLKDSGIAKIKNANSNYSFADGAISGMYTYTITAAQGSAKLTGSADKTYDGHSVTTVEVNSTDGNIQVTFTIPAGTSTTQRTYQLQDGDYTWDTANGQAPTNAGTYTIKINPAKLQSIIDQIAGTGNVTIDGDTGKATFTINKKDLNVTLGDKTGTNAGKTYDGQAGVIDPNDGSFTPSGLISGETLNTANIPASDYQWVDENGNPLTTAPTDAGTYYVALNADGLKKLQDNNPNYNITESGMFKYVISPAEADVTIGGSQESTKTDIDNSKFSTSGANGITIPAGLNYQFTNGTPSESGVYDITLTPGSLQSLKNANKNYNLNITSNAKFTLDATLTITFEDTTEGNVTVPNTTVTKTGANGKSVDLNLTIPENYELAAGQTLPTSYTFGKALNQNLNIKLVHKTTTVDPTKPNTNPDPTNTDWFKQNNLTKDVTRTINYEGLTADQLSQIPESEKRQTIHFTRTAQYDLVTGKLVPNSEGTWMAQDGNDQFAGFTPHEFAGYTADTTVPEVTVSGDDSDSTITITYTANDQSMNITYVDDQGHTIKKYTVSGKTDQTVNTNAKIPAGWVLEAGQTDAPTTITFTATSTADITIKIKHGTTNVPHDQPVAPGTKTPTGQPINGAHESDLNQTITRTIKVNEPSKAPQTITQEAHLYRDATYDDVTGEVTYGDWSTSSWADFKPATVDGYTASQADVAETPVTSETKPVTVNITYTANDQTGKIIYQDVDNDNAEVGHTDLNGKTGETITITPHAPAGYDIVPGQTIPATETATANGIPDVIVKVSHHQIPVTPGQEPKPGDKMPGNPDKKPGDGTPKTAITYNDLHKAMTRTINVTDPHTGLKTTKETLNYERIATIDDVTGEVTYGDWTVAPGSQSGFDVFNIPPVPGYTAKITSGTADELKAMTPNQDQINNWTDETIDIDYTANDQSMNITYVDKDGNPVDGGTFHVSGKTDQTVDTNAKIPTGWVLVPGQTDAPKTITFTGTPTANIKITIEHGTTDVPHNQPLKPGAKTPTGKPINGAHERDLNQTITRTITIHEPGKTTQTITQEAHIYRDATYDDVTGEVTYGAWSQDDKAWAEFDAPIVDGYTANQTKVDAVTVKNGQKNVSVDITYNANDQTQLINYVDDSGKIVKTTTVPGKTAQTVDIPLQVPEHYEIVPGQSIPEQVTLTTDNPPINVKVTPKLDPVTDPAQLNKTITRTITINKPSAKPQVIKQTARFTRTGETNEVTGKTTFTAWTVAANGWTEVDAPAVPGYTPDKSKIDAVNVTADMTDTNETINYLTNAQTGKIVYVDKDGDEISHTDLAGKTGAVITITPQAPIDWKIVPGQSIPKTVTAGSDGIPTVKIVVEHDTITVTPDQPKNPSDKLPDGKSYPEGVTAADLNKTVTRTITINVPNKAPQVIVQKADFSRTATIDLVSHAVTYSNWQAGQNGWLEVTAPTVPGYTPDQATVPADNTVTVATEDSQVTIDYTANVQTQVVNYVDPDGNTIKSDTIPGHTDETVAIDVNIPEHYELVPGQTIPKRVTLTTDNTPINVKVTPKLDPVTDPAQLNKTITRTITINKPGEAPQVITQQATFTRTGKHNEATGITIFTPWMLKDNGLVAVNAPTVDGYTPSQAKVAGIEDPTVDTKLTDVEITYTANDQSIHIVYKDEDGNTIKTDLVSGKTDQTVDVHSTVPAGWQLADGQSIPKTVTFKAAGNKDAVVTIEHMIVPVSHTDPLPDGEKTPTGEPINGAHDSDLNQAITRTINVTTPDNKTTTIKQVAHIYRDAAYDDVTGEVTYGAWSTDPAAWQAFTPAEIAGYTPSLNTVPAVTVADGQENVTIDITYAANTQPSGEPTQPTGNQPTQPSGEPTQPTGNQPTQPSGEPTQPTGNQPTQPSGEPTQPTGNQPTQPSGEPTQPSGQSTSPAGSLTPLEPAAPDHSEMAGQPAAPVHGAGAAELNTGHIANDNSISSQLTHYANGAHKHTDQLPQTGNDEHKKASALGFIFATLASLFGMAGFKKKKKDEQ